jgi:hypothetical protein
MLQWIGVILLIILILVFFYRQAIHDFRINQANASRPSEIMELWRERVPLVIREIPRMSLWTHDDVIQRQCYEELALFKEQSLAEWIRSLPTENREMICCPWYSQQAEKIAGVTGISIWAKQHLQPLLDSYLQLWKLARYHSWAGRVGVQKTYAAWTCILPVESDIIVTIFPETMEIYLPVKWRGSFPIEWTKRDTPFVGDIKYMDIVVRPGTCLFLPPHWFFSWSAASSSKQIPMVFTVSYHHPISLAAFRLSESNT